MEFELSAYTILFCVAIFVGSIDSIVGEDGLITTPALMANGILPHLALATNKLQGVFGSFTAAAIYFRSITLPHLAWGVFFTAPGAAFGTWSALLIKDEHLKLVILIFLSLTFLYIASKSSLGKRESEPKIHNIKVFHLIFGLTLDSYDGFLGPRTGSFWILTCVLFLGFNTKKTSTNTKTLNLLSNIIVLFIFLWFYDVLWLMGLLMGVGQVFGAFLDSKLVLKTNGKLIKMLSLVIVGATIIKVAWDYFS